MNARPDATNEATRRVQAGPRPVAIDADAEARTATDRSRARHLEPYVPPSGDEPLDEIEQAIVRMFVRVIVRELRAQG